MIQKIGIKDFKSYQDAELKLAPLTVLIGANASGKTNALEAIRLLSWMAQGQRLYSLQGQLNENDSVVRGSIENLPRTGKNEFTLECKLGENILEKDFYFTLDFEAFDLLTLTLEISDGELHIAYESVKSPEGDLHPKGYYYLYQTKSKNERLNTIDVEYNNFKPGGKKPTLSCNDQTSIFLQLALSGHYSERQLKAKKIITERTKDFEQHLSKILFLDPVPQKMRAYWPEVDNRRLHEDGRNISSVIYDLWNHSKNKKVNRKILIDFIKSLPEQNITDIKFIKTPTNDVRLQLKETFGGKQNKYDTSLLSDGTLRILSYAAALLSAPEGSMVIVEEIDNGVHPSRAEQLLDSINDVAKKRNLTVLISSHNPALLDALPNDVVPKTVFCYRDPESGFSKLTRLEDLPRYPELLAQGSLGDLLTRGLVDKFVKNQTSEEERQKKALEWLDSIK